MVQRKLTIFVTEVLGADLAEDSMSIRWELHPYDSKAVERSLDLLFAALAEKFADYAWLLAEDQREPALGGRNSGSQQ